MVRPLIIGHRGVRIEGIVENTLQAFAKSFYLGADRVELDAQVLRDGTIVVKHDPIVSIEGRPYDLIDLSWDDLQQFDYLDGTKIPRLDQVIIDTIARRGQADLYVELKADCCEELARQLDTYGTLDSIIVGSFNKDFMEKIKWIEPRVKTSILIPYNERNQDFTRTAQQLGASYVHPCWERDEDPQRLLTDELIQEANGRGMKVIVWHEEREDQIKKLITKPVYGICTDDPLLFRRYSRWLNEQNRG